jgi:hypothetical protein
MVGGDLITWFTVSVSYLVYKGLGKETTSSIGVRALEGSKAKESIDDSRILEEEPKIETTEQDSSTGDSKGVGYTPFKSTMSKSRPSSRRQSTVAGKCAVNQLQPLISKTILTC